jgi:hypothetical protein
MTQANFWFDKTGDCKDPKQAAKRLEKDADKVHTLSEAAKVAGLTIAGGTISLGKLALLMMGKTEDLKDALIKDYSRNDGIQTVVTPNTMRLWYVRRMATGLTKTVAIIASWPDYWGSKMPPAVDGISWHDLWPTTGITHPDTSVKVSVLEDYALLTAKDKKWDFVAL